MTTVGVGAAMSAVTLAVEVIGPTGPASWEVQAAAAQGCSGACEPSPPYPYANVVVNDEPLMWWTLDDGNGATNVENYGSITENGNYYGSPSNVDFCNGATGGSTCSDPGAIQSNGSASFNSADLSVINTPAQDSNNTPYNNSFSAEGWFETLAPSSQTEYVATITGNLGGFGVNDGEAFVSLSEGELSP